MSSSTMQVVCTGRVSLVGVRPESLSVCNPVREALSVTEGGFGAIRNVRGMRLRLMLNSATHVTNKTGLFNIGIYSAVGIYMSASWI